MLLAAVLVVALCRPVAAQPAAGQEPPFEEPLTIIVESVSGKVEYGRGGQFQPVTLDTRLTQGDTVVAGIGAVCKLEFQNATSQEVLSATIVRGYTEITIAEAYRQGSSSRTTLDLPQGVIRTGVVRTAVPPSFRVRTPRTVVAVRGTEIRELEVSNDRGDFLRMGVVGVVSVEDRVPWFRAIRKRQGTQVREDDWWRSGRLLRAIENAVLDHRVILTGPHRRGLEQQYAERREFDPVEFGPGGYYNEGDPLRDRHVNAGRPLPQFRDLDGIEFPFDLPFGEFNPFRDVGPNGEFPFNPSFTNPPPGP
jgi:hypothetical protein